MFLKSHLINNKVNMEYQIHIFILTNKTFCKKKGGQVNIPKRTLEAMEVTLLLPSHVYFCPFGHKPDK